jgi:hypothetical protein
MLVVPEQDQPDSTVHILLQPSPFAILPSSQASGDSTIPSPQIDAVFRFFKLFENYFYEKVIF